MINILLENTERKTYLYNINWGLNCPNFIFFTHNIPTIPGLSYFISYKDNNGILIEAPLDFTQIPSYVLQFAFELRYNALENNLSNENFYKFSLDINFQNCNGLVESKILDLFEIKILGNNNLICSYPPLNLNININNNPLEINVNWSSVAGTTYYEIHYNDNINFYKELTSDTSIILNSLNIKRNNTYFIYIIAICSNNLKSEKSLIKQFSTPLQIPEQYPNATLKNYNEINGIITFFLEPPIDKLETEIAYLLTWGEQNDIFLFNSTNKLPELKTTGLKSNTLYYFKWKTIYNTGESSFSSVISYQTESDLYNQSINCLSPDKVNWKQEINGNNFNLIIDYKENLSSLTNTEIYIRYKKLNDTIWIETKAVLPLIIENLDILYPYEFSLKSICDNQVSEWSKSYPINNDFYCLVSDGFYSQPLSENSIKLNWNEPPIINGSLIGWDLSWKPKSSSTWIVINNIKSNEYILDNLSLNTYYDFGLNTICQKTTELINNTSNVIYTEGKTLFKKLVCPNIKNIYQSIESDGLLLSWDLESNLPEPLEYKIVWRELNSIINNTQIIKLKEYKLINLLKGSTYEIIITTICGNDKNKYEGISKLIYYKDPNIINHCLSPINLKIEEFDNGLKLLWEHKNSSYNKFKVVIKNELLNQIDEFYTNKLYYDFFDIKLNQPYKFSVITYCQNDLSLSSNELTYIKNKDICSSPPTPILNLNNQKLECFDVTFNAEQGTTYKLIWNDNEILLSSDMLPYTICPPLSQNELIINSKLYKLCETSYSSPSLASNNLKLIKCKKIDNILVQKNQTELNILWENLNDAQSWRIYWLEGEWINNPNNNFNLNELLLINNFTFNNINNNYLYKIIKNCSNNELGIGDEFSFLSGNNILISYENNYLIDGIVGDNGGWKKIWLDWLNEINSEGLWFRWGNELNGIIQWKEWNKEKLRNDNILNENSAKIFEFNTEIFGNIWFEMFQFNDNNKLNWSLIRKKL